MESIRFIAILGGSGSGKTWLARRLKRKLGASAGILPLDDFYRDLSAMSMRERNQFNFDHPDAIDWELFITCLDNIRSEKPTRLPRYDFETHTRKRIPRVWKPRTIVLVEGLWLLHRPDLRSLWSQSVFVDCPEDLRLQRRIARDQRERGRSVASIRRQFHKHVGPMHDCYVTPQTGYAKIVLTSPLTTADVKRVSEAINPGSAP